MRRLAHALSRLLATVALLALLIGVPLAVGRLIGWPTPSVAQLRSTWRTRQIDTDTVIKLGSVIFVLLWAWFAVTALSEAVRAMRWQARSPGRPLPALQSGPGDAIRRLVRLAVLSTVSVGATLNAMLPAASTSAARLVAAAVLAPSELPVGSNGSYEVVRGDSYWRIADHHLADTFGREPTPHEVFEYVDELMELNVPRLGHRDPALIHPGEVIVYTPTAGAPTTPVAEPAVVEPAIAPVPEGAAVSEPGPGGAPPEWVTPASAGPTSAAPASAAPTSAAPASAAPASAAPAIATPSSARPTIAFPLRSGSSSVSLAVALGGAAMVSAGAIRLVGARRRRQLRSAVVGARLVAPSPLAVETEAVLRSLGDDEQLARIDLAIRAAARELVDQSDRVAAIAVGSDGEIRMWPAARSAPTDPMWRIDLESTAWVLPASVTLEALAERAHGVTQPCPALVHIGAASDRRLYVDLEAAGTLCVDAAQVVAQGVLRAIAAALAVSPFAEAARLITVGLSDVALLDAHIVDQVETLDAALDVAAVALGSTSGAAQGRSTFALRAASGGGEAWEPAVVLAVGVEIDDGLASSLAEAPVAGLAVVVDRNITEAAWVIRPEGSRFVLEPLGICFTPARLESQHVLAVAELLDSVDVPLDVVGEVTPLVAAEPFDEPVEEPFDEVEWALLVTLLGNVSVVSSGGEPAPFERSKALELVAWLSQHREHPTRTGARTALWDLDVRDATFANVVSDARRAMARVVLPHDGEEWIARTLTEHLPMHDCVVTDAQLLTARVLHARRLTHHAAIEVLRPGLELVAGLPFAGTSYLWPDAEGITSALTLLTTGAATELANHYLAIGDAEGVFWATGQGLKVLAGHEELIALRMRAHANNGDHAGVRHEWDAYERALRCDPWSDDEPSPKLVTLRRELLTAAKS